MRLLKSLICATALMAPVAAHAQGLFSPVITVNDTAITGYELAQREQLLVVFRTPGDVAKTAREQLIDDRLRKAEMESHGFAYTPDGLKTALEEFAARTNQPYDAFIAQLAQQGVDEATLRDYVAVNGAWRDYVSQKYARSVTITEADIDAAIENETGNKTALQVLLSEIIIPMPPEKAAEVKALAEDLSHLESTAAFSEAAGKYSAVRSRENGGRLEWQSIDNLPAPLHPALLALQPGQVTAPLDLGNAVALLQMRDLREVAATSVAPDMIDYAVFTIPGGLSPEAQAEAARIDAMTDRCDDLYGVAKDLPVDRLTRTTASPATIETDIALELNRLDPGESAATITRNNGQTLLFVMMCQRIPQIDGELNRDAVRNSLRSRRLGAMADALLADLRDNATIVGE